MKVLYFIQSLFVPSCMINRKKMNIFISLAILLLSSFLIAVPMMTYFKNSRYELLDENLNFKVFQYCVDESSTVGAITEEEKQLYNMVTFEDIKALGIKANKKGVTYTDKLENAKDYVVKSYVPTYDEEGTITNYTTYYIHIVVDDYDANNGGVATYNIENEFCKLPRENDGTSFNHFLVAFYNDGVILSKSDVYSDATSINYAKDTEIDFTEATDMTYCSHAMCDLFYHVYQYLITKRTFIHAFLFPLVIAFIMSFVIKAGALQGVKEFIAIAAVSCITPTLACFLVSWVNLKWCSYAFNYYAIIDIFYYLFVMILINKKNRTLIGETK